MTLQEQGQMKPLIVKFWGFKLVSSLQFTVVFFCKL